MNDLLDDDDAPMSRNERELTLSTGAILGIFFGLVLLCGACFGVGYNMGRKSAPTPLALNDNNAQGDSLADSGSASKPAAGTPLDAATPETSQATVSTPAPAPKPAPIVRKPPPPPPATDDLATPAAPAPVTRKESPAATTAVRAVPPSALMPAVGTPAGPGSVVVQVAAVSHKEDADLLVGALRARGYTVAARQSASDGFIHVQVGPFSNKKDAEAMRQRLIADGYNAILK